MSTTTTLVYADKTLDSLKQKTRCNDTGIKTRWHISKPHKTYLSSWSIVLTKYLQLALFTTVLKAPSVTVGSSAAASLHEGTCNAKNHHFELLEQNHLSV